ncbi:hypothetical protein ACJX0J_020509 [Zea mays]
MHITFEEKNRNAKCLIHSGGNLESVFYSLVPTKLAQTTEALFLLIYVIIGILSIKGILLTLKMKYRETVITVHFAFVTMPNESENIVAKRMERLGAQLFSFLIVAIAGHVIFLFPKVASESDAIRVDDNGKQIDSYVADAGDELSLLTKLADKTKFI